jgi:hypothetical protein
MHWDGTDGQLRPAATGVYFAVLKGKKTRLTQKLIMIR